MELRLAFALRNNVRQSRRDGADLTAFFGFPLLEDLSALFSAGAAGLIACLAASSLFPFFPFSSMFVHAVDLTAGIGIPVGLELAVCLGWVDVYSVDDSQHKERTNPSRTHMAATMR